MLGKIWGIALILLAIYVGYLIYTDPQFTETKTTKTESKATESPDSQLSTDENEKNIVLIPKTPAEISEQIDEVCTHMQKELRAASISPLFHSIRLRFREKRLEVQVIKNQLSQCFRKSEHSPNNIEIEVFSSDFSGENAAHQIQLQASILQKVGDNKIYEVGGKFELAKKAKKNPSLSTRVKK